MSSGFESRTSGEPVNIHNIFASCSPHNPFMGGERASTTRQREAGKICCECRLPMAPGPDHEYGERLCSLCTDARIPKRTVFMYFSLVGSRWQCRFLEADLKTSLPRKLHFSNDDRLIEMAKRGRAIKDLADKQALEHGIANGRGTIKLHLTSQQYESLKRDKP